ncbi:MAG: acyl-CoA dehydrogenase [Pirellulales bacterium]
MPHERQIVTPNDPALDELCRDLAAGADALDLAGNWPAGAWRRLAQAGVPRWFSPRHAGGLEWSEADLVRGYLRLSQACLTTSFVLTQWVAAVRRIIASENQFVAEALLPDLLAGQTFATVGISHLTTSRQHLKKAVLQAQETSAGFVLDGYSPWVTGGSHADTLVVGATLDDGRQILLAAPAKQPGVQPGAPANLVALGSSHTGEVRFSQVEVPRNWLLAGPAENVMAGPGGANTGGLQTSTLALGLSAAAIAFLQSEAGRRADLAEPQQALQRELAGLVDLLLKMASDQASLSPTEMRTRANSLALRTTQAALAAAKGAGFVAGHPAGRWCRESLFFLVWSCPQPVLAANLCELAGLRD